MEKLLHERLREWGNEACPLNIAFSEYDTSGFSYDDEVKQLFNRFADEIERYYIQRPRFEDGEPVQFGEEFDSRNDGKTYSVNFIGRGSNGVGRVASGKGGCGMTAEEPLKRPTPKVYDADGVEIKVGDTVYSVYNGSPMKVEQIRKDDKQLCGKDSVCCGGGIFFCATEFTHEKPVFDADGVRICKGDTVWHVYTGQEATVTNVYLDDKTLVEVKIAGHLMDYEPSDLTHKEPDSIERILDDATIDPRIYYNDHIGHDVGLHDDAFIIEKFAQHLIKRAALIERGA